MNLVNAQSVRDSVARGLPAVLLAILTFALTIPIISQNSSWSPIDEQTHIDYAWRISHGEIPHAGDLLSDEVLADWSCSGQENAELPACGSSEAHPEDYPNRGENYNYFQTPVYYFVAGIAARAVTTISGESTFDTALRYVSSSFTAVGLILLYLMMLKWDVPRIAAFSASVTVLAFPNVLASATRATPDSAALLSAVAAVFVAYRVIQREKFGLSIPILLTALLTGMKTLSALPMLCLALYLFLSSLFGRLKGSKLPVLTVAASIPITFLVVYVGWSRYQDGFVPSGWVTPVQGINTTPVLGTPFGEWLNSPVNGADLAAGSSFPSTVGSSLVAWLTLGLGCLSVAVSLAGWMMIDRNDPWRSMTFTLLLGVAVWPTLVQLQAYIGSVPSFFPHPSPRYGLSLIGLVGVSLAMVATRRKALPALTIVAGTVYLLALGASLDVTGAP